MQNGVSVWRSARPRAWQILVSGLLGLAGLTLVPAPAHAVLRTCDQTGLTAALGGGTSTFSCVGATTILLTSTQAVAVSGTVLDGGGLLTISGNGLNRVFTVNAGVTATLQNMTITGGNAGVDFGGGIANNGTLTISNSTVSGNSTGGGGSGGGIANSGTLTISNSTVSGNSATVGGGILNFVGTLTISNSTVSGNSATVGGGGIANNGTLTISNSTVSGNSATVVGGGIFNGATLTIRNSIVANSPSGGNCAGPGITDGGNNLDSANTCGFAAINNSLINTNPNLGTLTGSPAYFPLNTGSQAIDAGSNAICAAAPVNNTSQNGLTRPIDGDTNGTAVCDIGSYEAPGIAGIPTLSEWAQIGMAALLVGGGLFALRRHRSPTLP